MPVLNDASAGDTAGSTSTSAEAGIGSERTADGAAAAADGAGATSSAGVFNAGEGATGV
jgi:hypothetical protein